MRENGGVTTDYYFPLFGRKENSVERGTGGGVFSPLAHKIFLIGENLRTAMTMTFILNHLFYAQSLAFFYNCLV